MNEGFKKFISAAERDRIDTWRACDAHCLADGRRQEAKPVVGVAR